MILPLLVFAALSAPGVSASAETPRIAPVRGDADAPTGAIQRFADELFSQGDWFRASTEYLRAASYDPASPDAPELGFKAALCAYRAGQWTEARRRLLELARASATELADRCRYLGAASSYRLKEYETARQLAAQVQTGSAVFDRASYLRGLADLNLERWPDARAAFGAVPPASALASSAAGLAGLADRGPDLPRRSPWVTAGLSAVVPGLGQIVSGYIWDGLAALLLTGGGAAILAAGVDRDNASLKATGGVLLTVFYPANVYGGANAAGRRNRQARRRLLDDAAGRSTLSLE